MPRHPAERALRAWRDGELALWRRLALHLHLRRCAPCRQRVSDIDGVRRLLTHLLATREPPVDVGEAWGRIQVRSGAIRSPFRAGPLAGVAVLLVALASAAAGVLARRQAWAAEVEWLLHPTPVEAKVPSADDTRFVERLLGLEAAGKVLILEDACCEDRDGEGPADDGLAIVRVAGHRATLAVLYEDLDGSGALTSRDLIRLISRTEDAYPI
jgi:hypothetical protein